MWESGYHCELRVENNKEKVSANDPLNNSYGV